MATSGGGSEKSSESFEVFGGEFFGVETGFFGGSEAVADFGFERLEERRIGAI